MAFHDLLVTEIFRSIQGETSLAGLPFTFIRLTGCNLRCTYCDSAYAFKGGRKISIAKILDEVNGFGVHHVLLTGGEPLLQRQTPALARALNEAGYSVSIETHGEVSVTPIQGLARIVMDIKTPSSGMCRGGFEANLPLLDPLLDEVKFVIASPEDYAFARALIRGGRIRAKEILLSPAIPAIHSPGEFAGVESAWLAERMLEDGLNARLQLQLHKILWGRERTGV